VNLVDTNLVDTNLVDTNLVGANPVDTLVDTIPAVHQTDRHRQRPPHPRFAPEKINDNNFAEGRCLACQGAASIAPRKSEYRGGGMIHHHWSCRACGHEWVSVLHVPE
jgi:hypothetical protein